MIKLTELVYEIEQSELNYPSNLDIRNKLMNIRNPYFNIVNINIYLDKVIITVQILNHPVKPKSYAYSFRMSVGDFVIYIRSKLNKALGVDE
jgi:hypothetical protein